VDSIDRSGIVFDSIIAEPVALIVAFHAWLLAPVVVTWQEWLVTLALAFQSFEFAGHIDSAISVITNVKRYNTDRVTGNEEFIRLLVVEHKGKDAAELFQHPANLFVSATTPLALRRGAGGEAPIQGEDDLTIATRLKLILTSIATTNLLVVIDLAIDSQHLFAVWREQRLSTTLWVHDTQSLMGKDGRPTTIDTTPVRSAMADLLTHLQRFVTQSLCLLLYIQYCYDSTHNILIKN
jgi:hypothetical protein